MFPKPGKDNTFTLFEDEGEYNHFENGDYALTQMSLEWGESACFTIRPATGNTSLIPKARKWNVLLRGFHRDISVGVTTDGKKVDFDLEYSQADNTTVVSFNAPVSACSKVYISGEKLIHDNSDISQRCLQILLHSQTRIDTKRFMERTINDESYDIHQKMWRISAFSPEEQDLADALKELLTLEREEFEGDFRQN